MTAPRNTVVYEVVERHQPHNQGWPEPPPTSHGLFAAETSARRLAEEIRPHTELLEVHARAVRRDWAGIAADLLATLRSRSELASILLTMPPADLRALRTAAADLSAMCADALVGDR